MCRSNFGYYFRVYITLSFCVWIAPNILFGQVELFQGTGSAAGMTDFDTCASNSGMWLQPNGISIVSRATGISRPGVEIFNLLIKSIEEKVL